MKKLYVSLCGCFIAMGISSCNEGGVTGSAKPQQNNAAQQQTKLDASQALANIQSKMSLRQEILKNNYTPVIRLGDGFDSRTGIGMGINCLANADDPSAITLSDPIGEGTFSTAIDSQTLSDLINAKVSGEMNFGLFSASAEARYMRDSLDTRQSIKFNYFQGMTQDAVYKVPGVGNKILDPDYRSLLEGGMDDFTGACGDSIVQSAKLGARLLVDVSIQFSSSSLKEKFEGEAKGSILGIGAISGAFSDFSHKYDSKATMSVRVLQLGGDVTKLANIYGVPDKDGNFPVVACSETNISACKQIINDTISYAKNDFQNTIDFKTGKNIHTFDYSTKAYSKFAVKATLPILAEEQKSAREYLTDAITQDRKMLDYLQAYQKQSFYTNITLMDFQTKKDIEQSINDYVKMIADYNNYQILDSCYGDTENINTRCIYAANEIKKMHTKYQQSINIANSLGGTVVVWQSGLGTIVFVPLRAWGSGNYNSDTYGYMSVYDTKDNKFIDNSACVFDTTTNNAYMRNTHPDMIGASLVCDGGIFSNSMYYVKRIANYHNTGVGGRIINGIKNDYPLLQDGYNASYSYSDATTLKYSPI